MRKVKMKPQQPTLDGVIQKFLLVKESQHTGEETMKDYRNCLSRFLQHSRNSLDEVQLENDVLTFFTTIPDTSPARYNKPFQNINALLNWPVEQGNSLHSQLVHFAEYSPCTEIVLVLKVTLLKLPFA